MVFKIIKDQERTMALTAAMAPSMVTHLSSAMGPTRVKGTTPLTQGQNMGSLVKDRDQTVTAQNLKISNMQLARMAIKKDHILKRLTHSLSMVVIMVLTVMGRGSKALMWKVKTWMDLTGWVWTAPRWTEYQEMWVGQGLIAQVVGRVQVQGAKGRGAKGQRHTCPKITLPLSQPVDCTPWRATWKWDTPRYGSWSRIIKVRGFLVSGFSTTLELDQVLSLVNECQVIYHKTAFWDHTQFENSFG